MNPHKEKQDQALKRYNKQKEMEIPLELVKIQDMYNKQNLKRQHKFNLEIFEKQSELTREIHKEQSKLIKYSIFATLFAALCGIAIGYYAATLQTKDPIPNPTAYEKTTQQHTYEKTSSHQKEKVLSSEQRVQPSTSVSSKPSHNQANAADPKGGAAD